MVDRDFVMSQASVRRLRCCDSLRRRHQDLAKLALHDLGRFVLDVAGPHIACALMQKAKRRSP